MSRPILVGFDPRSADVAPVRFGAVMARVTRAPLMIVSVQAGPVPVTEGGGAPPPLPLAQTQEAGPHVALVPRVEPDADLLEDATSAIEDVDAEVRAWGLKADFFRVQSTSAARALHEAAERQDAGLLVVGSSLRGGRILGGSTAERLLHGSPCAVAVVPPNWASDDGPHVIGVGYVASDEGRQALRSAAALARRAEARLLVINVARAREAREHDHAEDAIRQAVAELAGDVPADAEVRTGDPAETPIGLTHELDALVCGSRGYGPVRAALLGSVTRRLTAEARCPVIVLPRGVEASLESLLAASAGAAAAPAP